MATESPASDSFRIAVLQSLETIQVSLNNLQVEQETCRSRIERLERKSQKQGRSFEVETESREHSEIPPAGRLGVGAELSPSNTDNTGTKTPDFQREYESIRDSLNRVRLPNSLKLLESKTGIKREDQSMFQSVSKSARYTETCLKLLASFDEEVSANDMGQLYNVLAAHMNFLQSEYTSLVVKGQFDKETATLFKCLEKHSSNFKGESLDNLKTAAEISAARSRTIRQRDNFKPKPWNKGRGRGSDRSLGLPRGRPDAGSFIPADRDDL